MAKQIQLTRGKFTIVDDEDFLWLNQWKWQLSITHTGHMYAYRQKMENRKSTYFLMHRELLKRYGYKIDGLKGDHINGNGLDNRRNNLRIASNSQNQMNRKVVVSNSGYKGVNLYRNGKYRATSKLNGEQIHLGYFNSKNEAAKAYNEFARNNFGEYANLNQI